MSGIIGSAGSKSGIIGTTELDYEEGTFTAYWSRGGSQVAEGTGSNQVTYTVQDGLYTKIGNLVTVVVNVKISADVISSGVMGVMLPFTSIATHYACAVVGFSKYWDAAEAPTHGFVTPSTSNIEFVRSLTDDSRNVISSSVGGSAMNTGISEVKIQVTYRVA